MTTTVCIQCALAALVDHKPPPIFKETPEAHMKRVHPDLEAARRERLVLEERLHDQDWVRHD